MKSLRQSYVLVRLPLANPYRCVSQAPKHKVKKDRSRNATEVPCENALRDFFRQLARQEDIRLLKAKANSKRSNKRGKAK